MYGNNAGKNYGTGGDFTVNSGPFLGARGPNEFWGNWAKFDENSFLHKGSGINGGLADSKTFSLVFQLEEIGLSSTAGLFFMERVNASGYYLLSINHVPHQSPYAFHIVGYHPTQGQIMYFTANLAGLTYAPYTCMLCVDTSDSTKCKLYVNNILLSWSSVTLQNYAFPFSSNSASYISKTNDAGGKLVGKLSELYFTTEYIDFSQEANRLKFRDAFGNPVDLGSDGSKPTSTAPAIYMRFDPANFGKNSGTGGDFTINGTILDGGQL